MSNCTSGFQNAHPMTYLIDMYLPKLQKVLVHSRSRTVVATLKEAHAMNKRFEVYVTQSSFLETATEKSNSKCER